MRQLTATSMRRLWWNRGRDCRREIRQANKEIELKNYAIDNIREVAERSPVAAARMLLESGMIVTTKMGNYLCRTDDWRKMVSRLKRHYERRGILLISEPAMNEDHHIYFLTSNQ